METQSSLTHFYIHMFDHVDGLIPLLRAAKPPFNPSLVDHVSARVFQWVFHVRLSVDPDLLALSHDITIM